jgi:Spy/CpxP family protein refolding chaperone
MTDSQTPTPSVPASQTARCRGRGRGFFFILAIVLAAGLTGALATKAFSESFELRPAHWRGGGFMDGSFDPVRAQERADRMIRHLAVEADATNEQQEKLRAVMKAAVQDLLPYRGRWQDARVRTRELLTQQTVDRAAIEKLRAEQIALADTVTKRLTQAVTDAAEVLTAEQRRRLSDHFPPHRGGWHGWRRG